MTNILGYLSNFDKIHGICILLKSNEARATIAFRYCLQELLKSLDKSAEKSIAFCLTNARGTFYQPGETTAVLREMLQTLRKASNTKLDITNTNTFCMDNEAFRYLAAVDNGILFDDDVQGL